MDKDTILAKGYFIFGGEATITSTDAVSRGMDVVMRTL